MSSYYGEPLAWEAFDRFVHNGTELVIENRQSNALGRHTVIVYFEDSADEAFRLEGGPYQTELLIEVFGKLRREYERGVEEGKQRFAGTLRNLLDVPTEAHIVAIIENREQDKEQMDRIREETRRSY